MSKTATWWTTVGFGGNPAPKGPWKTREAAAASLQRWLSSQGHQAGTQVAQYSIRVYGYPTRDKARLGDISDTPGGRHDCISIQGLHDFLDSTVWLLEERDS